MMDEKIGNICTAISGTGSISTGFFGWFAVNGSTIAVFITLIAGTITIISGIYAIYSKRRRNKESEEVIKTNKLMQKKLEIEIENCKKNGNN
jgi:4-hydroxybenzoate polyprenyltransferase